jgi:hypothetical protein
MPPLTSAPTENWSPLPVNTMARVSSSLSNSSRAASISSIMSGVSAFWLPGRSRAMCPSFSDSLLVSMFS